MGRSAAAAMGLLLTVLVVLAVVLFSTGDETVIDEASLLPQTALESDAATTGTRDTDASATGTSDQPATDANGSTGSETEVAGVTVDAPTEATPAPEPAAAEPAVSDEPVEFTMAFSGDILSHSPIINRSATFGAENDNPEFTHDYRPMFSEVQAELEAADLAICVLETPISTSNGRLTGYPTFYAPKGLADSIAAVGFDGCATASNHSFDQASEGLQSTLNQLDRVGVRHAGMARSAEEQEAITVYDVMGVKVAHLSYTYGLNGFVLPEGEDYLVNVTEETLVLEEAARAKADGADMVVLSIQWGNEYQREPTPVQLGQADVFTASGDIDLIVGNHAHVVQPVGVINDVPVIFGLGNFLSNQSAECCIAASQDGVIIVATVRGTQADGFRVVGLTIVPTWVDRSDYTIIHLGDALDGSAIEQWERDVYQTSFDRTMEAVTLLGANFIGADPADDTAPVEEADPSGG